MAFRERLWPSPGVWVGVTAFGAALGLVPAPISATAGWITAAVCVVVLLTLTAINPPTLRVTDTTFEAGRARLPLRVVSGVEALDADAMRVARGRTLDARAYLCLRGWVHTGVRISLADPDDPAPYWLVSSRRPDQLARAVRAAVSGGPDGPGGATGGERTANDHASES